MAATVMTVSSGLVLGPGRVQRLLFFPSGSEYLKYSPHFHTIQRGGFRTNFPLSHGFFIILDGKLSVKDYWGVTTHRIEVKDQVWYFRDTNCQWLARWIYAQMLPGWVAYERSRRGA